MERFKTAVGDVEDTLNHIEKVAAMYQRQYRGDMASWFSLFSYSPRAFQDTATLASRRGFNLVITLPSTS